MTFQLQSHELNQVANAAGAPVKFWMRCAVQAPDGKLQFLVEVVANVQYMPPHFDSLAGNLNPPEDYQWGDGMNPFIRN